VEAFLRQAAASMDSIPHADAEEESVVQQQQQQLECPEQLDRSQEENRQDLNRVALCRFYALELLCRGLQDGNAAATFLDSELAARLLQVGLVVCNSFIVTVDKGWKLWASRAT